MADSRVRLMRPADRAALRRLGQHAFAQFGEYGDSLDQWLRHPRVVTVVAGSPPAGFAMVAPVDGQAYLLGICVDPTARRTGVGQALLGEAIGQAARRCKHWGVDSLSLEVAEANTAARSLFAGAGFADAGAGRAYADGQASRRMQRPLGSAG